ncbi:hypothetical protein J6590_058399 [Homalodisca vitripennis]|nr:hypothetical protein J6590_058399 [Homalodisca vitripennis]
MPPMEGTCRLMPVCMTHKALTLGEPQYLCERLVHRDEVSQRSTRHDRQLHFRRVRLEAGRKSFSHFGPKLHNELPECLKSCLPNHRITNSTHHVAHAIGKVEDWGENECRHFLRYRGVSSETKKRGRRRS